MRELINIQNITKAYFLGIGGIGMSAVARYFNSRGVAVSGYDKTSTALTQQLEEEGIFVHFNDDVALFPQDADLVVYTPAIPADNNIFNWCKNNSIQLLKRSDVLEIISRDTYNICIAGTHGKTTTSTMVAHVLRDSGFGCNAFLGGIATNYQTNFWSNPNPVAVIEADEYDRSFLKLYPNVISISAMDPDHLDIYHTAIEMEDAFVQFTSNLKKDGLLLSKKGIQREAALKGDIHYSYHLSDSSADIYTTALEMKAGGYQYDVVGPGWTIDSLNLKMGGMHNVENSLVAVAVAKHLGIADNLIRKSLSTFLGVKRRFEYIVNNDRHVFIDDYAHHPEELKVLIQGAKAMFPDRKCTVVFQPHLFTRTRDLADGFAEMLALADEVILLPIYPARELPVEGITSEWLAEKMKKDVKVMSKEEMIHNVSVNQPEMLITAGAGDIDKLVEPLKNALL
ncbi:MAG: UDP-N-acetylmuramate--L-alanine ligase [Chitinophagaceae bacterium]